MKLWEVVLLVVTVAVATVLIGSEIVCGDVREFWKERPLLAGFVSGGVLLAPLLLLLDRLLDRRMQLAEEARVTAEQRRWRGPALDAVRAYADTAGRIGGEFRSTLAEAVGEVGVAPSELPLDELVVVLAERGRQEYERLAASLDAATVQSSSLATSALYMLTLHPELLDEFQAPVSESQQALAEMVACSHALASGTDDADVPGRLSRAVESYAQSTEAMKRALVA